MMTGKKDIKTAISRRLLGHPIFYICRDIERALGLYPEFPGYIIITNTSPFSVQLAKKYRQIVLIKEKKNLDTWQLLEHPRTKKNIKRGDHILVFKNTPQIEQLCRKNGWKLLNPTAKLAGEVEEKISQVKWLGPLKKYLPPCRITIGKKIKWTGRKFILQFNRSHTGSGTLLVSSRKQLKEIQEKFPQREVRITEYIPGPLFTNNNIVWDDKVLTGNINYQITGLKPFTDSPFATIGNDWALPHKILSNKQIKQYNKIATAVGRRLKKSGWKGLFGIDVVRHAKTGKLYLLEINARQPASTSYESQLQSLRIPRRLSPRNDNDCTTFEAHLGSLLGLKPNNFKLITITDGAQIIQRVTGKKIRLNEKLLIKKGFNLIKYNNDKPGSDYLRIQSKQGIMSKHNKFNKHGLEIL